MKRFVLLSFITVSAIAAAHDVVGKPDPCAPACPVQPFPKIQNCRCNNLFAYGEFLYWRYSSPNLAFGRTGIGVHGAAESAVTQTGTSFYPNFKYDPGFRVGIGIKFGEKKAFDLVGIYTYIHNEPKASISGSPIDNSFQPLNWYNSGTLATNLYSFAELNLHLTVNYAEVQSGYSFPINPFFALRPYFALTSYIINASANAIYELTTPALAFQISKTHATCDSWSIGPKVGVDFTTHITKNWGIYTNFNITQQISHVTLKTKQTENTPATGASLVIQRGRLVENDNIGLFGLEIGPTWDQWFCDYSYHVYVRATYGASNITTGANLTFLNSNNQDLIVNGEFRGFNVRALLEF